MEEYVSFHKVLDLLQQFQENNERLNSFGYGNLVDFGKNVSGTTVVYPFLFVVPLSISYDENTTSYQLTCIFADRLNETLENEKDCVSDMSLCARDLLSQIKRGDLFGYFETTLPAQAQPFMERFNDNVAGVALDLNVVILEDINACVQYPTPTPSQTPDQPTPSVTPTSTVTPSVTTTQTNTPSVTPTSTTTPNQPSPTVTSTPSSTPPVYNPVSLGAMWWIDFTDVNSIYISGSNTIDGAKNLITDLWSFSSTTNNGPIYQAGSYYSVSGSARSNVTGLSNALGTFNTSISGFTIGMNMRWQSGQFGAKLVTSYNEPNYLGQTQGYQWFRNNMPGSPNGPSTMRLTVDPFIPGLDTLSGYIVDNQWSFIMIRVLPYPNIPNQVLLDIWYNNGLSNTFTGRIPLSALQTTTNQIFNILYDGGFVNMTEVMFFPRGFTVSEMNNLRTYFQNKYPLQ